MDINYPLFKSNYLYKTKLLVVPINIQTPLYLWLDVVVINITKILSDLKLVIIS